MPLAQLADLFDTSTWYVIFAVGWGSPALAILLCFLCFRRVNDGFVAVTVVYYIVVCIAWAAASASEIAAAVTMLITLPAGPIFGCITFITHLRTARSAAAKQPPTQGFPVVPIEPTPDAESD